MPCLSLWGLNTTHIWIKASEKDAHVGGLKVTFSEGGARFLHRVLTRMCSTTGGSLQLRLREADCASPQYRQKPRQIKARPETKVTFSNPVFLLWVCHTFVIILVKQHLYIMYVQMYITEAIHLSHQQIYTSYWRATSTVDYITQYVEHAQINSLIIEYTNA